MAHGILVPTSGMEPKPPAAETWSLNHWTAREVSPLFFFFFNIYYKSTTRNVFIQMPFSSLEYFPGV